MSISPDQVEYVARLARLDLSDQEKQKFGSQLGAIFRYVEKLKELDTSGVEPLVHAAGRENVFRDDQPAQSLPRQDALANAPESSEGCFRVPPIIE